LECPDALHAVPLDVSGEDGIGFLDRFERQDFETAVPGDGQQCIEAVVGSHVDEQALAEEQIRQEIGREWLVGVVHIMVEVARRHLHLEGMAAGPDELQGGEVVFVLKVAWVHAQSVQMSSENDRARSMAFPRWSYPLDPDHRANAMGEE